MLPLFFDNYMLRFGETFSTLFMEELAQGAWRMKESKMLLIDEDVELLNYYDMFSVFKYNKLAHEHDYTTGYNRILYKWRLRLKYGFELTFEVEELNDDNYADHEQTKIEINVYIEKDGYMIRHRYENDPNLTTWDIMTLRQFSPLLDMICGGILNNLHRKLDTFNERQRKQNPIENQAFFERLMQSEEFREVIPLTEQIVVNNGKLYMYPEQAPSTRSSMEMEWSA
jgi:hypothetical protein